MTPAETTSHNEERQALRNAIRDFAARECGSHERRAALANHGQDPHNQDVYEKVAALGWIGCAFPEEYGGEGGATTDACVVIEELHYGMVPVHAMDVALIVGKYIEHFGTEEQKKEIIGAICRGEVAAVGMSEPDAGSDVGAVRTRAVRTDGGYVINGQKTWTTCAHIAQRIMVVCRTDSSGGKHDGLTILDVDTNTPGVDIRTIPTLGGRQVNDVYLTEVFVGADRVIGVEGNGWRQLMHGLNFERLTFAAAHLGTARRAFDDALTYVKEREQFGRPVGTFQAIKHRIADLATEIECCRVLVYDVARRADENPDKQLPVETSMVKLKASETAKRMAIEGIQLLGGAGYTLEHDMHHHLHMTLPATIAAGTSEIQREIISKGFGL